MAGLFHGSAIFASPTTAGRTSVPGLRMRTSSMKAWTRTRIALPENQGFDRCTLDSGKPGLRVVVFGGTHGDEIEGILAANRLANADLKLLAGILEVVPIVHEAAFYNDSRMSPLDGGNLARVFPGDP